MNLSVVLNDKTLKPSERVRQICNSLITHDLLLNELLDFAKNANDSNKASCIEAIELVTEKQPEFATNVCLDFVTDCLNEKAPRIKWESARVIGNIAHLFPADLEQATVNLLKNAEHSGTVVRWSTAFALGKICKSESSISSHLIEVCEQLAHQEEKNSIKKIYLQAIKNYKS